MRKAAELAWQRPSGLEGGGRDTCSKHVGLGTCWEVTCSSMGHLLLRPGESTKDNTRVSTDNEEIQVAQVLTLTPGTKDDRNEDSICQLSIQQGTDTAKHAQRTGKIQGPSSCMHIPHHHLSTSLGILRRSLLGRNSLGSSPWP